jgi:hypothetical protein
MIELDQDPVTTDWRKRKILLPSTDVNDNVEFKSYTTRIEVKDDHKLPAAKAKLRVASASPVPAYIEDVYYVLRPDYPVSVECDNSGSMTIVQQTESLAVVTYKISIEGSQDAPMTVDPSAKATQTLQKVSSGTDLSNIKVANDDGSTRSIVPDSVSQNDRDHAAAAIKNFCDIGKKMNKDGTPLNTDKTLPKSKISNRKEIGK